MHSHRLKTWCTCSKVEQNNRERNHLRALRTYLRVQNIFLDNSVQVEK